MKIKLKTLKKPWAACYECARKAPHCIAFDLHSVFPINIWLCEDHLWEMIDKWAAVFKDLEIPEGK